MRPSIRVSFQIFGNSMVATACTEMFQCKIACSARPFETFWIFTRNEWGPADHMCSCKKQLERPKSLRVAICWPYTLWVPFKICGNSWVQYAYECLSATFQCSARPFETFWIFTRNKWGPADHMCSCKKQSERPKSLRVAVVWPCAQA